jgi:hypothetical protein
MTDHKEGYVLREMQRGLSAIETWHEHWNIKIKDKTQATYFSHTLRPLEAHLTLNGQNIPSVNHVKYLAVIFNKTITWRLHIEMTEAKAFTLIRIYSLFKCEHLSTNMKLTVYMALIRSIMTYACPASEFLANTYLLKLQHLKNKVLLTIGYLPRCTLLHNLHMAFKSQNVYSYITNWAGNKQRMTVCSIGQGEARHRKYNRLKLSGNQAYDHSSD